MALDPVFPVVVNTDDDGLVELAYLTEDKARDLEEFLSAWIAGDLEDEPESPEAVIELRDGLRRWLGKED